jgi:hypothetical protein
MSEWNLCRANCASVAFRLGRRIFQIVNVAAISVDEIMSPGIRLDRVVVLPEFEKPIESRFTKEHARR